MRCGRRTDALTPQFWCRGGLDRDREALALPRTGVPGALRGGSNGEVIMHPVAMTNARLCGVSVAALMAALLLISVSVDSVSAQTTCPPNPAPNASNVVLLPGYSITAVASCLNFPTAMTFQDDTIWVTEEGTSTSPPAVKQIDNMGNVTTVLAATPAGGITGTTLPPGTLISPLTGIVFEGGYVYLVHRQTNSKNAPGVPVGAVSRFQASNPLATFQTLIAGFPSFGDHPNSQIVFGADGRAYINGAAPTNSSVVGPDNSWAPTTPTLHDFPGVDIELSGNGYQTLIPWPLPPPTTPPTPGLDPAGGTSAAKITMPFMAFGGGTVPPRTPVKAPTPANPIQGIIAGGGTVYSFDPNAADPASTMQLEAWGFRNPYGIGFDPSNKNRLFVSNNGADVRQTTINGVITIRGSRPIDNDYDDVFVVQIVQNSQGKGKGKGNGNGNGNGVPFFGHPDYFHDLVTGKPVPVTDSRFCPHGQQPPSPPPTLPSPCPQFAFSDEFRATLKVQPAFAEIPDLHGSANMFDFSPTQDFGFKGDIFIAETGSIPTGTGASSLNGFKVARIERGSGKVSDFITHPCTPTPCTPTQAVVFAAGGFNKPIDVRFHGSDMFIVDLGIFAPAPNTPNSGKIWKVTNTGQ
jgi:hypothetical protein